MATITFDTLKFVEKLRAAGVPEAQAKAEAEALAEALGAAKVATVRDIECLGSQMGASKSFSRRPLPSPWRERGFWGSR
ncbi:MAG: DUF1640 domain-containing protein [Pseudomonadota bacterium]